MKADDYQECYDAVTAIWRDEGDGTLDEIALMATINSILANKFDAYFWTGFYRVCGDRLVVGPYIGTVGCLQIEFGRGVCGAAAERRETIVVPVFDGERNLIAVLDVDSDRLNAFDDDDRAGLERIVALFSRPAS